MVVKVLVGIGIAIVSAIGIGIFAEKNSTKYVTPGEDPAPSFKEKFEEKAISGMAKAVKWVMSHVNLIKAATLVATFVGAVIDVFNAIRNGAQLDRMEEKIDRVYKNCPWGKSVEVPF